MTVKRPIKKNTSKTAVKKTRSTGSNSNRAKIKVVGIGGGGGNAISRMKDGFIRGIEFIAINTDAQDLDYCNAHKKVCIGKTVTRGLGTGMNPELGRKAAVESKTEIAEVLQGADLIFITAGLGGGTGSGASPLIAEIAREVGALTVAVVTKPFTFEGGQRTKIADEALAKIKDKVDTYIVVPNDKIFEMISKDTSINKAFEAIDDVLRGSVQGIAELIAMPGIINVDFADVRAVMKNSGAALVGMGMASGKDRGLIAVGQVLNFPLIDVSINGAKGILFGISGGRDVTMAEINEVAKNIVENVDATAKVIFGAYYNRKIPKGKIKVTLIATNFEARPSSSTQPEADMITGKNLFEEMDKEMVDVPLKSAKSNNYIRPVDNYKEPLSVEDKEDEKERLTIKKEKKDKSKSSEMWDIPAFLRRKKDK